MPTYEEDKTSSQRGATAPRFTIDRRPRLWVQTVGNDKDPANGYNDHLRKGAAHAVNWATTRIAAILAATGPTPVILHVAPGKRTACRRYTAALAQATPPDALAAFTALRDEARKVGAPIEPYIGWAYDPDSSRSNRTNVKGAEYCVSQHTTPGVFAKWCDEQYRGWITGRVWLDELEDTRLPARDFADALERQTWATVGGEAFPIVGIGAGAAPGGVKYAINQSRAKERPWLTTYKHLATFDPTGEWTADPQTTEMHVIVTKADVPTEQGMIELAAILNNRGFIVGIGWDTSPDVARVIVGSQRGAVNA
jgi:hypothetical protein